ncbi:MAG: TolB family protein [Methanohalophilus sp.]
MNLKYILCFACMIVFFIVIPCSAGENTFAIENSTHSFAPYWSPDGTYIAYSSSTGSSLENLNACLLREDGTNKEKLTSGNESGGFFFDPWSPEGDTLLYISNLTGNYELWTMHRDGFDKRKLTEGALLENYLLGLRG